MHSALLATHPCSKLWYFLRALDRNNRGWVEVETEQLQPLNASTATIYRWLDQGKQRGFFWFYSWSNNKLRVRLGGLTRVCKFLKIQSWGVTAEIPLAMLLAQNGRRVVATAITTQDLQERSRYAADKERSRLEQHCFKLPTADQLLNQDQTSQQMIQTGGIRGLVHRGQRRIFVNRRFVPFGASHKGIAYALNNEINSCGFSRWTLQRHLNKLEVNKRQIMQAKPEYKEIQTRINQGASSWDCKSDSDIYFRFVDTNVIVINEPNGDSSARRPGGNKLNLNQMQQYQGTTWVPRPNIYDLKFELTSMKHTRYLWKQALTKEKRASAAIAVKPVENSNSPLDPPQEERPQLAPLGSAAGGQNKSSNFENSEKTDCEPIAEDLGRQTWLDAGAKLKALVEAQKRARLERLNNLGKS
ncbi:hypothetical protein FACHB389_35300 [Nostoc calcicola FACHB-389]|nr:hypothetical protein FACHB389_35300 [Nostoc calcicola FACHB-389]